MTLYEINAQIEELLSRVDPETGELILPDYSELDALELARDEKIEDIACYIKDLDAEAKAIKAEADALTQRRRVCENKAARLRAYLEYALHGEKFQTARCSVSYRNTQAVDLPSGWLNWAMINGTQYLRYALPEPDKTKIKDALKAGEEINGAALVTRTSMMIK